MMVMTNIGIADVLKKYYHGAPKLFIIQDIFSAV
jgi:hypothetical protein